MRSCFFAVSAVSTVVAVASPVFAEAPEHDAAPSKGKHGPGVQDFHFSGGPGYSHDSVLGGAVAHSLTLGYRYGYFEPALVGDFGTQLFGGAYAAPGVSLGAVVQSDDGFRFTLRGVIGSDSYAGVGCGLFCKSGGASATLPYAGARIGASYVFRSHGRTHLELGLEGFYGRDLERRRVTYTTTGDLFDSNATASGERTLGGERLGFVVTVGLSFDTAPTSPGLGLASAR